MAIQETDSSKVPSSKKSEPELLEVPSDLDQGLYLLGQAYDYARKLDRDAWDFAVELPILRASGLNHSDLRYLVCAGYIELGLELSAPDEDGRQFDPTSSLKFNKRSCFILTNAGASVLERHVRVITTDAQRNGNNEKIFRTPKLDTLDPEWDSQRHELRLGDEVVKRFKLPSPNQETVLSAFQEEAWPPRIDDPLPPVPNLSQKRRLHDTIKSLNRNQRCRLVRFTGDGTGCGVCWSLILPSV